jgi:hypothetical protein
MRREGLAIVLVVGAVAVSGCSLTRPFKDAYRIDTLTNPISVVLVEPPAPPADASEVAKREYDERRQRIADQKKRIQETYGTPLIDLETYPPYKVAVGALGADREATRNSVRVQLTMISDEICAKHQADILSQSAATNLVLGTLTSALAGAAAIVSGLGASALAGGAAFSNATRSGINEEVYAKHFAPAIVKDIQLERNRKKAAMENKRGRTIAEYTLEEALFDVNEYHQSCSFYEALVRVSKATERTLPSPEELMKHADDLQKRIAEVETKRTAAATAGQTDQERNYRTLITQLQRQIELTYLQLSLTSPAK